MKKKKKPVIERSQIHLECTPDEKMNIKIMAAKSNTSVKKYLLSLVWKDMSERHL